MSETDDTDDLLLIPPDIFVSEAEIIESYASGPYFNIVDSLISQVSQLENRVESIEHLDVSNSTVSTLNTLNTMDSQGKFSSSVDEIHRGDDYSQSTFSTPQKPRMRYRMHSSLPSTPMNLSPQKPLYAPATHFQSFKEKTCRTELKFDEEPDIILINGKEINLAQIESMLRDIEEQKRTTEVRLREKEHEILPKSHTWRTGDDSKTLPPHIMDGTLQRAEMGKLTTAKLSVDSVLDDKTASISSTDSSQITTRCNPNFNVQFEPNAHGDGVQLMSLNELWEMNHTKKHPRQKSLREKVEEERVRRQHCEKTIQELQSRVLELRERLTVAVKIDHSKDRAIVKFHDSWEKLVETVHVLREERDYLECQLTELHSKSAKDLEECAKNMEKYETEASKAINLADDYEEKIFAYKTKNEELQAEIASYKEKLLGTESDFNKEANKNRQLNEIIIEKELEINQGKNVLAQSRGEIAESKRAIELCQIEFTNMKTQYAQLENLLSEKQRTIDDLEKQKRNLLNDNDNLKQLLSDLQEEVGKVKKVEEKTKADLREFYQKQVETLVKCKLKEFQAQLDKAENSLGDEIKKRELSIAKTAAGHIQQLNEKHSLEVNLLEEKHKEEVKFYQMQITQAQKQIDGHQQKLKSLQEKRATMAQQLHKVMESQWLEALKIINSNKSPFVQADAALDQLKTLKYKSHTNLEQVLFDRNEDANKASCSTGINDDQLLKYNVETPVSSKTSKNRQHVDNELQKYINLLLSKNSQNSQEQQPPQEVPETSSSVLNEDDDKDRDTRKMSYQASNSNKPPWK